MKNIRKVAVVLMIAVLTICNSFSLVSADQHDARQKCNIASTQFITLFTSLFEREETFELFDADDICITDSFIAENKQFYDDKDFDNLYNVVLNEGYVLQYGEEEVTSDQRALGTHNVSSSWKYQLKYLNNLVSGKTIEYTFRVHGQYTENSSAQITSYHLTNVEYVITDTGDLFPYTVTYTDTTYGSSSYVSFGATLYITVYYAYSNAGSQTVSSESYRANVYMNQ